MRSVTTHSLGHRQRPQTPSSHAAIQYDSSTRPCLGSFVARTSRPKSQWKDPRPPKGRIGSGIEWNQMHDIDLTRLSRLEPRATATPSRALRVAQSMCLCGVLIELVWSANMIGSPSGPSSKRRLVRRDNRPRSITCTVGSSWTIVNHSIRRLASPLAAAHFSSYLILFIYFKFRS